MMWQGLFGSSGVKRIMAAAARLRTFCKTPSPTVGRQGQPAVTRRTVSAGLAKPSEGGRAASRSGCEDAQRIFGPLEPSVGTPKHTERNAAQENLEQGASHAPLSHSPVLPRTLQLDLDGSIEGVSQLKRHQRPGSKGSQLKALTGQCHPSYVQEHHAPAKQASDEPDSCLGPQHLHGSNAAKEPAHVRGSDGALGGETGEQATRIADGVLPSTVARTRLGNQSAFGSPQNELAKHEIPSMDQTCDHSFAKPATLACQQEIPGIYTVSDEDQQDLASNAMEKEQVRNAESRYNTVSFWCPSNMSGLEGRHDSLSVVARL